MDMSQYRDLFISESREHIGRISDLIVCLERDAGDREAIDALFREAHSVKGMAASMGYDEITELSHKLEDLMDRVRKGALVFDSGIANLLLEGSDLLEAMVSDLEGEGNDSRDIADLLERLIAYPPVAGAATLSQESETLDKAAEPIPFPVFEAREASHKGGKPQQTVRVKTQLLDRLINITGELITNKHRMVAVAQEVASTRLDDALGDLSKLLGELHYEVMQVRMMPFAAIADRFPRVVRDLARQSGKEVAFEIAGTEIELDRGILEELTEPLVHILRNAVDHGMETSAERQAVGKPAKGRIRLAASREQDMVIVTVEDDGRGMDPNRLIATALDKGIITKEEGLRMSPWEALMLTCIPGFSTARQITDSSGRGVGMDAVRTKVQAIGGSVAIDSEVGEGSRITLKLPLTIAIIDVLLARCGQLTVAVPVTNILRTFEIGSDQIVNRGKEKVYYLDNEPLPLTSLNSLFGVPATPFAALMLPFFVCEIKGRKVGVIVDQFLGYQEVFVKPIGRPLAWLNGVSGVAVLGNGEVIFILDVINLR